MVNKPGELSVSESQKSFTSPARNEMRTALANFLQNTIIQVGNVRGDSGEVSPSSNSRKMANNANANQRSSSSAMKRMNYKNQKVRSSCSGKSNVY